MARIRHISFIGLWLLLSGWEAYWMINYYRQVDYEKRIASQQWSTPADIGADFNKSYLQFLAGHEDPTLKTFGDLKFSVLGQSITPKVQSGKEGWLFLAEEDQGRNSIHQSLGIQQYSNDQLVRWTLLFKQRRLWSQKRGIDYFLVIAPNKASIYPEFLPARFRRQEDLSRLSLIESLGAQFPILDLSDSLKQFKDQGQLYFKNDTHWNDLGAWSAYQATIRFLSKYHPQIGAPLELDSCLQAPQIEPGGDLARLILQEGEREELSPVLNPPNQWSSFDESRNKKITPNVIEQVYLQANATIPKAIFDHDSFFQPIGPYFAGHFQEYVSLWGWQAFAASYIEKQAPTLVVDEWVERSLIGSMPRNNWWMIQEYWQKNFDSSANVPPTSIKLSQLPIWRDLKIKEAFTVLSLDFELEKEDKLIIEYEKEKVYYPLSSGRTVYFLEWPKSEIKRIHLESDEDLSIKVLPKTSF